MTSDQGQEPAMTWVNGVNVTMRICGWCEEVHPEHISIDWFPGRLYFCSDGCYGEWSETA